MLDIFKDFLLEVNKDLFKKGAYWTPTLATLGGDGLPQARTVVLREIHKCFDTRKITFTFHTDTRSKKWAELQQNPRSSLHFYCPKRRWQMRIGGSVNLIQDEEKRQEIWVKTSPSSKEIYRLASAPGTPQESTKQAMSFVNSSKDGFTNFGVIEFKCDHFDSLKLLSRASDSLYHERMSWCIKTNKLQILVP